MGNFVNKVSSCVTESLECVALGSIGNLVLIRDKNVILLNPEKDRNQRKVEIVCGGGSGHEPAHSSFVNHEMLSAAICGDVFASPSVGAIVDGIRTLVGNSDISLKAVLVIVKNHTGDKINFGMACEMELGVGIHGERGVSRTPVKPSDEIVTILIDKILAAKQQLESENNRCKRMVLLTNNLGSVSGLEMGIVHRKAISYLNEKGYEVCRAYCGTYMTCLDMRGMSLSLLTVVDDTFLDLLDVSGADFTKTDWKPDSNYSPSSSASIYIDAPEVPDIHMSKSEDVVDQEIMRIIENVCNAGVEARETLNNLDRECGDGDAGDTLATACNAILSNLLYYSVSDVNLAFRRIAECLTNAVGGTSGPLYAVFFIRAATAFNSHANSDNRKEWKYAPNWVDAIQN